MKEATIEEHTVSAWAIPYGNDWLGYASITPPLEGARPGTLLHQTVLQDHIHSTSDAATNAAFLYAVNAIKCKSRGP